MKPRHLSMLLAGTIGLGTAAFMGRSSGDKLVVHEWGTFTSLQGSDGVPLSWNPLESSQLPNFVYNWSHPGLGRSPSGLLAQGRKSALVTLQRMETPVIYFYSDKQMTVDVTVRFPKGGITEWYPQAPQVGPSFVRPGPFITSLDSGLHRCGVSPSFTVGSLLDSRNVKDSLIHWSDIKLLPVMSHSDNPLLLRDSTGSHYFAARDTDSTYLQAASWSPANSGGEYEKFLFYRGVGNFTTPLVVSMPSEGIVSLVNSGPKVLSHLLVLRIEGEEGASVRLDSLKPGAQAQVPLDLTRQTKPLARLRKEVEAKMREALIQEGLFPREASAMVNTWDDSWFQEPGVRVLYLLPREWTDGILPIHISPDPQKLVRVMVGRAELVTPGLERRLTRELTLADQGAPDAVAELKAMGKELGRFASPVFAQALQRTDVRPDQRGRLLALLYQKDGR